MGFFTFFIFFIDLFLQGELFHAALESIFLSEEIAAKEQGKDIISGYLSSVQHVLKDISEVKALESAVQHETLQYLGLVDCVAKYRWGSGSLETW